MSNDSDSVLNIRDTYVQQIDRLPVIESNSAAAVLYSSVLAVTLHHCAVEKQDAKKECKAATSNEFYDFYSGELKQLTTISSPGFLSCLTKVERAGMSSTSVMNKTTKPLLIEGNDFYSKITLSSELVARLRTDTNPVKAPFSEASIEDLRSFEIQAMIRLQILRLIQPNGIPLRCPMTAVERGIKETELLTFSSLCSSDLYRGNQLQEFEAMILEKTKSLPNFTGALSSGDGEDGSVLKRKYFRYLSAFLFAQFLSKELVTEPIVLKKYYEMTDELLYCLHWPPPNRRNKIDQWSFSLQSSPERTTDGTSDLSSSLRVDSVTMTPAGKSIAMLKEINNNHKFPWFTAYYHDCMVGLRLHDAVLESTEEVPSATLASQATFFALTDDDVRINVFPGPSPQVLKKPDKCGTVCVTSSYPNGLSVTVCTNGDVRVQSNGDERVATCLSSQTRSQYHAYSLLSEISRFISKNASISRSFARNSAHPFEKEIMLIDGTREIFLKHDYTPKEYKGFLESSDSFEAYLLTILPIDVRWITLHPDGSIESCNLAEDNTSWIRNPSVTENIMEELIDAETKSISRYFRDGRLITLYRDDTRVILFPDQTKYVVQPKIGMVNISRSKGWPTIEIDSEVDAVSRSHCQGLEVPINKGGERVRLRVAMPDGLAVVVKYDTRVTAKTNGSLKVVSRTRTSILARDDGSVIFTPSTAWTNEDEGAFQRDSKIDDLALLDQRQRGTQAANFHPPITQGGAMSRATRPQSSAPRGFPGLTAAANTSKGASKPGSSLGNTSKPQSGTMSSRTKKATMDENGMNSKVMNTIRECDEPHSGHDLFASSTEPDALIYANVLNGHCTIKDYEFNSFEMDLAFGRRGERDFISSNKSDEESKIVDVHNKKRETPMDVTVLLAGEVPGLKPPAVARYPKPPRLFVINRNGEATEVMSVQDVSVIEHKVKICPDSSRFDATALISPSELGPAKLIKYFTQKRLVNLAEDGFSFADVYLPRNYLAIDYPASSLHFLQTRSNINYFDEHADLTGAETLPRVFESTSLIERIPLSQEGYFDIIASFKRCDEFRNQRIQSIDRFAVDDPRTPDQIEEEEQIIKRLKQAYKIAKINAAKRKEQLKEREDRIAEEDEEEEDGTSQTNSKTGATKGSKDTTASPLKKGQKEITIMESQQEDKEEDEEIEQFSDDEDNGEIDPEIMMTKTAFEDYASPSALASWGGDVMPVNCLQEVFIRVFNRFISQEDIDQALSHTEEIEPGLEELTLNEFRAIYRSMKKLMNGEELERPKSASAKSSPRGGWGETSDCLDADLASEITGGSAYMAMMASPPSSGAAARYGGKSAPPLNLSTLEWNKRSDSESIEHKDSHDRFAAGSAMNHIRRVKSNHAQPNM